MALINTCLRKKRFTKLLQNCRWDYLPDLRCRAQHAFSCVSWSSEKHRAGQRQRQTLLHAFPLQKHEHTGLYLKNCDRPSRAGFNTQLHVCKERLSREARFPFLPWCISDWNRKLGWEISNEIERAMDLLLLFIFICFNAGKPLLSLTQWLIL